MCHFQTRRASGSQAESVDRAGGVSSLYLTLIYPLPASALCAQAELLFRTEAGDKQDPPCNSQVSNGLPIKEQCFSRICGILGAFGILKYALTA